jgi:hypothetical protein
MVYLKYNSVKLPVLDNYNIAKSSQEITFSDLKCDFTGHQKADLPEKYQEVRVVEESKVNREIEKIEYEEKKDVKELSFESKVKEKISICKVHGYSSQETTEGYQLLNLQSGMQNGITYYVDDEGYFYISGTCTSDRITLNLNEMVLNGTYTFTSKSISGGGINCALKDNTSEYKNIFWANNNNNTKEVNAISKDLVCYLTNGATYNSKIKLMLVSGSQEKDVEPYTGGIPSPSPDYPSEIKTVKDNINIKIADKNNEEQQEILFPLVQGQKLMQGDYLADDGIHHTRKQVVLDGSDDEGWGYNGGSLSNNISAFTANISNLISVENTDTKVRVMCNKTIGLSASEATKLQKYNAIAVIQDKRIYLCVQRSSFSTSPSTLKTWLQSNPITVEYELAEEVVEPYTVEQQKAWNNMQNLVSYVGINNINSSTNIDVKYPVRIKKEIVPETYDKLLYTGYIDDYVFDEMRELDEDINVNFTLLSPQKIATLRTCIAVGTYEIKDLIENIILAPLIDDGFTLKEINIVNKSLTVNFLVETVEYCMNNLSNKYNFWWYIDENKNIYVKDIETMFKEEPMYIYDDKHTIDGLEYVKPITNSYDYANVINFKNVRIYEYSRLRMNKKEVAEAHNPLIDGQVTNIKQNDQITFNFPIDIKKENIIKSANSNGITNTNIIYGIYVEGTYEDNTDFSFFVSFDTLNNLYKISDNLGFDGESTDSEKEFLLMRDSFFSNLITGIKYNNGNKKINSIKAINSDSTLIYNVNKFLNDKGILEKKNIISKTGIVERTIDMKESWKTVQELTEIGASYLNKNSLNYADELEIKLDKDKFQVGKILYINKFMIDGRYVVTEIQRTDQNNDDEFLVKCKNANILDNFIDIFRQENEQTSSDKVYQLYVTHYEEEGISERFEVVQ